MAETVTVYLSLGSNLGNRKRNLELCCDKIKHIRIRQIKCSSIYETSPIGPSKRKFLNLVVKIKTSIPPEKLLKELKQIEASMGRTKDKLKWGPRPIDIDILFYEKKVLNIGRKLIIPHKLISERLFVLIPLNEISPGLVHPVYNITVSEMLKNALLTYTGQKVKIFK